MKLSRYWRGFGVSFVAAFDALQRIRAGDFGAGTQRIETACFVAANTVYAGQRLRFVPSPYLFKTVKSCTFVSVQNFPAFSGTPKIRIALPSLWASQACMYCAGVSGTRILVS